MSLDMMNIALFYKIVYLYFFPIDIELFVSILYVHYLLSSMFNLGIELFFLS